MISFAFPKSTHQRQVLQLLDAFIERGQLRRKADERTA